MFKKLLGCLATVAILATSIFPFIGAQPAQASIAEPQYTQGNEILNVLLSNPPVGEDGKQYLIGDEVLEKRTEYSKTYWLGGKDYSTTISLGSTHYKDNYADPTEAWKDIDLTWVNNRISKAPFELTRDGKIFTIRDKKTGKVSTIELISSQPAGLPFEVIVEKGAVRFRHILASDKIPFEAQFKVTGKFNTFAFDDGGALELETSLVGGVLTEKLLAVKDKLTREVRPAVGQIRVDPTWQVGASTDDVMRQVGGVLDLTFVEQEAGEANDANNMYGGGMRFLNITIPQGSTIDQSYLTLRARTASSGTVVRTRISAEDVDDAITFANDAAAYDARFANHTTARVDWDGIAAWTVDVDYNSPEINTVIQEIVDRAGWVSGNDIVIFWEDYDNRSAGSGDRRRMAYSYDTSTDFAPKLVILYTIPAPVLTTNAASSVEETTATASGNVTVVNGANITERGFVWDTSSHGDPGNTAANATAYADNWTETGSWGIGQFTHGLTGLNEGTLYYLRAGALNDAGFWGYGAEITFLTKPEAPTLLTALGLDQQVNLSWTKGAGADNTTIRGNIDSYPATYSSNTSVYNNTGTSVNHTGLTNGDHWYYRAWSIVSAGAWTQYSDAYAQADATPYAIVVTSFMVEGTGRTWAVLRGYIDDEGAGDVTTTLVEWGLASGVYTANTTFNGVWNTGDYFVLTARSLQPATVYYWRVGARNTGGSYFYGNERVLATEGSASLREYLNTGQDGDSANITGTTWWAQQFTTSALGHSATSVRVYIRRYGNPGTITLSLRHATAGLPTGLDEIEGVSTVATYAGNSLLTSYMMVEFDINDVRLSGSTQYAIVLRALAGDSSNGIYWGIDNGGGLANAVSSNSTNGGLSWSSETPKDALFEIWGEEVVEVKAGAVFRGYLEDNDMLFVLDVTNSYPPYYPEDNAAEYFDVRVYDTDGTTVIGSTPLVDWARRPVSVYLSADSATPLTWGSAYYLRLVGSFDPTNVIASYQLASADWKGSNLAFLDRWVITEAHLMETDWNATFVESSKNIEVLNDAGGAEIDKGIVGLSYVRPDIFKTAVGLPSYSTMTWSNAFEDSTDWETEVGSGVVSTMDTIGNLFTVDGRVILQFGLVMLMVVLGFVSHNFFFGLILSLPIALWGVSLHAFPVAVAMGLGSVAALVIAYKWFFTKV